MILKQSQPETLLDSAGRSVAIHTHGCKLNQADSSQLARRFVSAGYRIVDSVADADVFVLNTCTVTATADAKARQALRAARRANPRATIVATGCYSQRAADQLANMDAVSLVVRNTEKEELVTLVTQARKQSGLLDYPGNPGDPQDQSPRLGRTRAMVKIQEGCNQVCSYCIVPKVRGRERSIPPEVLIQQINQFVAEGYQEVVLTGTQLGSYGFDISDASLLKLVRRILEETPVPRLRVSSLQPQEISPALLELWQDHRLCPHFHLPLQSGSNTILKAMGRRYDSAGFARAAALIRSTNSNAAITADLIVGFPGEGGSEFQHSRDFVREMGFSDLHVFPFSSRPGTGAAHLLERVPEPVKKERVAEMLAVAHRDFLAFRASQLGQTRPVLWESPRTQHGQLVWKGLTDNYIRVNTHSPSDLGNTCTPARLSEMDGDQVYATLTE